MPPKTAAPRPPTIKTRYFKGKPGGAVADSDSDSDDNGEDQLKLVQGRGPAAAAAAAAQADPTLVSGGAGRVIRPDQLKDMKPKIKMDLAAVKIPDGGASKPIAEESSEEEESDDEEETKPSFIPRMEDSSEYETDSEEESEEEAKPAFRPVFVSKTARKTVTVEQATKEAEDLEKRQEEEREQRKLDSKELAGETIRRELAEKEVSSDLIPDVDDTDGLDPEAEFDAWRVRELARLLRDKKAQDEADAEREEIERRRAMPEDQRMAEDMEYADGTRNKEKAQMAFLQKYYHKGAFHQDGAEELFNRDYTGMTRDQVDMSSLPAVLQVRDFGKKSRSKYTHLTAEDTSSGGWGTAHQAFGRPTAPQGQQTGCWNCGGDHNRADCPNQDSGPMNNPNMIDGVLIPGMPSSRGGFGGRGGRGGGRGGSFGGRDSGFGTAANNSALGSSSKWGGGGSGDPGRSDRDRIRDRGDSRSDDRDRRDGRDRDRDRDRDRSDRDRRSSRSPPRRDSGRDRDRERDRGRGRDDRDRRDRDRDRDHGDRDRGGRDRGDRDSRRDRDRDRGRR